MIGYGYGHLRLGFRGVAMAIPVQLIGLFSLAFLAGIGLGWLIAR